MVLCASMSSWAYSVKQKIVPANAWIRVLDDDGNLTGGTLSEIPRTGGDGQKMYGVKLTTEQLAGWEFAVVDNNPAHLTLRVTKCNTSSTVVIVPGIVQDSDGAIFTVTHSGMPQDNLTNIYSTFTEVTFSEGMEVMEYGAFRDSPNLKALHFPSTFNLVGTMMFESKITNHLAEITVHPNNQTYKTNNANDDEATNNRLKNTIGSKYELKSYSNTQLLSKDGKILLLCATNYLDEDRNPQAMRMIRVADGVETLGYSESAGSTPEEHKYNVFVFGGNIHSSNIASVEDAEWVAKAMCEMFLPSTYRGVDIVDQIKDRNGNDIDEYTEHLSLFSPRAQETQLGHVAAYYVDPNNTQIYSQDGVVYKNWEGLKILVRYPSMKSYPKQYGEFRTAAVIPDDVNWIWDDAFKGCEMSLVNIPESVTRIGYQAFKDCAYLSEVFIPKSVTLIREAPFSSCNLLRNIIVDQANKNYSNCFEYGSADGVLYEKNSEGKNHVLICFPAYKNPTDIDPTVNTKENPYKICKDVTYIAASAARANRYIQYIDLQNVQRIDEYAFNYCFNLREIELKSPCQAVGKFAFSECSRLKYAFVGNTVNEIGMALFATCGNRNDVEDVPLRVVFEEGNDENVLDITNLFVSNSRVEELSFPKRIRKVGTDQIASASPLKKVTFADNSHLSSLAYNTFSGTQLEEVHFGEQHELKTIGANCFANLPTLRYVSTIPASVTTIGNNAFAECPGITEITFEENSQIKKIGNNAFQRTSITTITLPDHLVTLQNEVFAHCDLLEEMIIPNTTIHIGHQIGKFCENLQSITVGRGNPVYSTSDGMLCSKNKKILYCFPSGKARDSFTLISPSIQVINDSAFYACNRLTNIVIPKKVHTIRNYAFYDCDNLRTITFLGNAPIPTEVDAAIDNQNSDPNKTDKRFGSRTVTAPEFIKNYLTFNIRKNGHESEYDADGCYWKNRHATNYSFHVDNRFHDSEGEVHEYFPINDHEVTLLKSKSLCYTDVVPAKVKDPNGKEYSVKMISDYAYEDAPDCIKEVVFLGPIDYLGANAFNNGHLTVEKLVPDAKGQYDGKTHNSNINATSSIEGVFFASHEPAKLESATYRFGLNSTPKGKQLADPTFGSKDYFSELGVVLENYGEWYTDNYNEFTTDYKQEVYAPKSKIEQWYVKNWAQHSNVLYWDIPGINITNTFGSFSREFDVDLSDDEKHADWQIKNWDEEKQKPLVLAYITRLYNIDDNTGTIALKVESINCKKNREDNYDGDGDGTFIPRNTGVLLHAINGTSPKGFYYRIAEPHDDDFFADRKETTGNIMQFVTEKDETISPKDNYIISGGGYKYLTQEKLIPVHKSYLHVAGIDNTSVKGAKTIKLIFDDDEEDTTAIDKVANEESTSKIKVYDLSGRRLNSISKAGMYIINGQKTFIK